MTFNAGAQTAIISAASGSWMEKGLAAMEACDAHSAVERFTKAVKADPFDETALEHLIDALLASEQFPQAALISTRWTETSPRSIRAWVSRGRMNLLVGRVDAARAALSRALTLDPDNSAIRSAINALNQSAASSQPLPFLGPLKPANTPPATHDPSILWIGPLLGLHSYGLFGRQSLAWLKDAGISVGACAIGQTSPEYMNTLPTDRVEQLRAALKSFVSDGICVMSFTPSPQEPDFYSTMRWRKPNQRAYVAMTGFETDGLPPSWIAPLNAMDEVWVWSQFNAATFAAAGIDENKLRVTSLGLDIDLYSPGRILPARRPSDRGFMFLSVFQWHARKGWKILVETFARTFDRNADVSLVIKTSPNQPGLPSIDEQISRFLSERGISRDAAAPIIVLEQDMKDDELRRLYRAADAFVLPTRGEGWGMPLHEAMALGLPAIATRWSGHLDFMNDENSYLIDIKGLVNVDADLIAFNPDYAGQRYADPDPEHLAHLMRRVIENSSEAKARGQRARSDVLSRWTHRHYVERIRGLARHLHARAEGRFTVPPAAAPRKDIVPIMVHGPALDPSGYAHDFRNMTLALRREGAPVRLNHQNWNARYGLVDSVECAEIVSVMNPRRTDGRRISLENSLVHPAEQDTGAYRIIRTFWETDRLPPRTAAHLAAADEVWVSSRQNCEAAVCSGIPAEKLRIIPVALDVERYGSHVAPLQLADPRRFTFLSCFDTSLRKGWDVILRAFMSEFSADDNVSLLLNLHSSQGATREFLAQQIGAWARRLADSRWLDEKGRWREGASPLRFIPRDLTAEEMPSFYRSGNAYIMASRGEGWSIPAMEAAASGLPVIATAWGGHMDYLDAESAFLVDFSLVPVSAAACRETLNYAGQMWAEPEVASMKRQMRLVRENPEEAAARAEKSARQVREKCARHVVAGKMLSRLSEISSNAVASNTKSSRKKCRITWEGCQIYRSSLALVNRELCHRLAQDRNVALHMIATEPEKHADCCDQQLLRRLTPLMNGRRDDASDIFVRHGWPPDFTRPSRVKKFVIIQPWEFGRIPDAWVEPIRANVDEIWVPSRHVFESYVSAGVNPERVWVIPNGINLNRFRPTGPRMKLSTEKSFKFLFVGGTIWRKGIDVLLKAWSRAFTPDDDVCLVIKDMGANSFYKGQGARETIEQFQQRNDAAQILYLPDDMSEAQMAQLYRSCDCLTLPYRGEGYGLPVAEAAACGLPVIVSQGGATDDFVLVDGGFFITCRRAHFRMQGDLASDGWVLEPDVESLVQQLQTVWQDADERRKRAGILNAYIRSNCSWDRAAQAVRMRLNVLSGEL